MPGPAVPAAHAASRDPLAGEPAWASYGALVTGVFVAGLLLGVGGRPLTLAVGAGTAALAAATSPVLTTRAAVALGALPLACAAGIGGERARELALAVALLGALSWRAARVPASVAVAAAAFMLAGVYIAKDSAAVSFAVDPGDSAAAAALLAAAAVFLLAAAAARDVPDPLTVLVVPALLAGLAAAGGGAVDPRLAVAGAGLVAVVAVAADRPAAALAALAVAASAGLDEPGVAVLLGVAAVLVAAWPQRPVPLFVIAAVPGLAGLAAAVAADPTGLAVGVGAFSALCAGAVVTRVDADDWWRIRVEPCVWPAAALAAWATIAPQTWGWLGPLPPAVTTASEGLALAVGVAAVLLVINATQRSRQGMPPLARRPRHVRR